MKSTYLKAPFQFEQRDVPVPEVGADEVLIKVKACGFCGCPENTARPRKTR